MHFDQYREIDNALRCLAWRLRDRGIVLSEQHETIAQDLDRIRKRLARLKGRSKLPSTIGPEKRAGSGSDSRFGR